MMMMMIIQLGNASALSKVKVFILSDSATGHKDRSTDKYPQHVALLDEHSINDMEDDIDQYRAAKDFSKLVSPSKDTPIAILKTFLLGSVKR